ncbi:type IV pilin protein [uncultured Thiohalocapsa sp.]|uniref:type IV pilin protein n=1 Tax=uncultured Thiohalocapsa sp. TaxID=768990 RepID=UPI0025CC7BF1|nr:type IV pilin protein [uncultured Thiohalocapsa sp.]
MGRQAAPKVAYRRVGRGFSLVELLVVVAIVAILAAVAYPSYQEQVRSGRRSEAQADLMRLAQFMERLYTENGCYNPGPDNDCSTTDDAANPTIATTADHYGVAFVGTVTADAYVIEATPSGPQAGDGVLRINQLGQRWWDEDRDGTLEAGEDNWERN